MHSRGSKFACRSFKCWFVAMHNFESLLLTVVHGQLFKSPTAISENFPEPRSGLGLKHRIILWTRIKNFVYLGCESLISSVIYDRPQNSQTLLIWCQIGFLIIIGFLYPHSQASRAFTVISSVIPQSNMYIQPFEFGCILIEILWTLPFERCYTTNLHTFKCFHATQ